MSFCNSTPRMCGDCGCTLLVKKRTGEPVTEGCPRRFPNGLRLVGCACVKRTLPTTLEVCLPILLLTTSCWRSVEGWLKAGVPIFPGALGIVYSYTCCKFRRGLRWSAYTQKIIYNFGHEPTLVSSAREVVFSVLLSHCIKWVRGSLRA